MNVKAKGNAVLAMDVARDDQELLVVTENGYGKRTLISEYPVKGRGTMGVKTIQLTENKGALAGALVVREHDELVFISQNGMVQRTSVRGISRYGRSSQGVRLMKFRGEDDQVSAVALVAESDSPAADVVDGEVPDGEGTVAGDASEGVIAIGDGDPAEPADLAGAEPADDEPADEDFADEPEGDGADE
jgi:DNA gyrase subunit A